MRKTKPCLIEVTDGAMDCPFCAKAIPKLVCGYVPLYRALDSRPCHVRLYDDCRADVDKIKLHARVFVGRGPLPGDTVYVIRHAIQEPAFKTADPEKLRPINLTEHVLRLWAIEDLIAWYNETELQHVPTPTPKTEEKSQGKGIVSKIMDGEQPTTGDYMGELFGGIRNRIKEREEREAREKGKPSANGKHDDGNKH
jgi:hypothetical protein